MWFNLEYELFSRRTMSFRKNNNILTNLKAATNKLYVYILIDAIEVTYADKLVLIWKRVTNKSFTI